MFHALWNIRAPESWPKYVHLSRMLWNIVTYIYSPSLNMFFYVWELYDHGIRSVRIVYVQLSFSSCVCGLCIGHVWRELFISWLLLHLTEISVCLEAVDTFTICSVLKGWFTCSMPCPCHVTKGLECVFPVWFTQWGRVWFILSVPCPCHAATMPFFSRPWHSTSVKRRPMGYLPTFGFFWLPRGVPRRLLSEAYQSQMQSDASGHCETKQRLSWMRKRVVAAHYIKDNLLNCWTSSSDIFGYHADFCKGYNRGAAWRVN